MIVVYLPDGAKVEVRGATRANIDYGVTQALIITDGAEKERGRFRRDQIAGYTIEPEPIPRTSVAS